MQEKISEQLNLWKDEGNDKIKQEGKHEMME